MNERIFLGIDVGGTHTDAVAVGRSSVLASCKVRTRHDDLLASVNDALETILKSVDPKAVKQLNLSTTLSTNAIVEGRTEDVGVLVTAGPGIDPHNYRVCRDFHVIPGALDHRGAESKRLDMDATEAAIESCRKNGVRVFAVVGKFSPRNPLQESTLRRAVCSCTEGEACETADFVTMGHELGGRLNFPRRLATAFFNCAVWRLYNGFADAVEQSLERLGLGHVRVNVLKADGGTMPVSLSRKQPVQSIFSGPAASVMGIISLCDITHDSIILDIGGTTTDIAIFASGAPLVEQDGIDIGSHPTLVRALRVRSIGIGGDSALTVIGDDVRVGPRREGPSMADGGTRPTLTDALNYLGEKGQGGKGQEIVGFGDVAASIKGIEDYAASHTMPAEMLARKAADYATEQIHTACRELVTDINSRPVYTIHELLENARIVPKKLYLMGGPAEAMKMELFRRFNLSTEVPENAGVANAVGAALTHLTTSVELFADTERGSMFIPALRHRQNVPASYTLQDAERDAMNHLLGHLGDLGLPGDAERAEITESSSFNMVEGVRTLGRNIRVKCQIKPGVRKLSGGAR